MFAGRIAFVGLLVTVCIGSELSDSQNDTFSSAGERRVLSRKRRFLLFPPGASFIVTISGGKATMFSTPRGYNLVAELDMYHPLPDYLYHATSLRLGTVAMYPDETTTIKPAPPSSAAHSVPHELTEQELQEYLAHHPDTWVPPSWSQDRVDSKIPIQKQPQTTASRPPGRYQWWKSKLWETTGNDRLYYTQNAPLRRQRSLAEVSPGSEDLELSFWNNDGLNISQHRGWEQFHHYRDRRTLYEHLETTIPSFFGFHMKECLLRSICEARNLLPPKGRSMTVDLLRVIFTFPLKSELSDDYSRMLRSAEKSNCRDLFFERCPLSILQLLLFGKFEL